MSSLNAIVVELGGDEARLTGNPLVTVKPLKLTWPKYSPLGFVVGLILPRLPRRVAPEHEQFICLVAFKLRINSFALNPALIDRFKQVTLTGKSRIGDNQLPG